MSNSEKKLPNILVTGTPGTGKSHVCELIAKEYNLNWLDCSKIAKEHNFLEEYDKEYECPILDEDKLLDYLEPIMQKGGNVVEYHGCDFFPQRWFHAVHVMLCSHTILHDRLKARGYNDKKIQSNLECEIFSTILEEAMESYRPQIVTGSSGESAESAEAFVKHVGNFLKKWQEK